MKDNKQKIIGFRTCPHCAGTGYVSAFGGLGVVCRCNSMFSKHTIGLEPIYREEKKKMTDYSKYKTIKSIKEPLYDKAYTCLHCGGDIRVRIGYEGCDHLYYPDNCDYCKRLYRAGNRKGIVDRFLNKIGLKRV